MSYYSRSYFTSDGTQTDYTVGFEYLDKSHVKVFVNGDETTDWIWLSDSSIRLNVTPAEGAVLLIRRASSPEARLVDYESPSSLNEADLDTDSLQAFYLAQEATDQSNAGVADDPVTGQFSAAGKRITNVANPVDDQDAATKDYVDNTMAADRNAAAASAASAGSSATAAASSASTASTGAATATTKAAEAAASATAAAASATAAAASESTATTKASQASTSASTATTKAAEAAASATAASGSATSAASSASSATGSASTASAAATTATTKAGEASVSASNAATSETNAAASAAAAAASASTMTPVADQIDGAADTAFADADLLPARKDADGSLIKRSWANIKSALAATVANIRENANALFLTVSAVWSAADEVALTDGATITVDLDTFVNASVTLEGNRTLGQPTNGKIGQSGYIRIQQDATGSRTLSFHADWKFAGGSAPSLTTTANAVDILFYQVVSGKVFASLMKNV